jgi:hypothetical protein
MNKRIQSMLDSATTLPAAKDEPPPRLTRRQGVAYLRDKHGIPITLSHFAKLCMKGEGPAPDERWGRYDLYAPATLVDWAYRRLRPGTNQAA